jgi:hypothetical protein
MGTTGGGYRSLGFSRTIERAPNKNLEHEVLFLFPRHISGQPHSMASQQLKRKENSSGTFRWRLRVRGRYRYNPTPGSGILT